MTIQCILEMDIRIMYKYKIKLPDSGLDFYRFCCAAVQCKCLLPRFIIGCIDINLPSTSIKTKILLLHCTAALLHCCMSLPGLLLHYYLDVLV